MFHPLWPDAEGNGLPVKKREVNRCPECSHGRIIHASHGGCQAWDCLCGWTRDMNGALFVKATGRSAAEVREKKRYKGAQVGDSRRARILKDPCYFCGEVAQTIDHFYPRAKGGKSDDQNLVAACYTCNGLKSDRTYEELIVFCQTLETATTQKTGIRRILIFQLFKKQARKILARHLERQHSGEPQQDKGAPVP